MQTYNAFSTFNVQTSIALAGGRDAQPRNTFRKLAERTLASAGVALVIIEMRRSALDFLQNSVRLRLGATLFP